MKDLVSKKSIWVAAVAILVALAAAITVALNGGNIDFATLLTEPFFQPLRGVMMSIADSVEELYGYTYRYDSILAENEELRARVAQLEEGYREYNEINEENARLRALLGFKERHTGMDFELEPVTIISWTASNFSSSFTINRGAASGIAVGDTVITAEGYLVGQVTQVGTSSSTVVSIIDTTMSVGAILSGTDETGIVEGDFSLFQSSRLRLAYLDNSANVIVGDTVLTSGRGGNSPAGLIIGYVESLQENTTGRDTFGAVRPAADLSSISHIYVITDYTAG